MEAWRARHAASLRLLTSDVEADEFKDWDTVLGSVQTRDSEVPSPGDTARSHPDEMEAWRARLAATSRLTIEDYEEDEFCNNIVLGFWQNIVDMSEPSVSEESLPAEAPDVDRDNDETSPSATSSRSTESTRSTARSTGTGKLGARSSKPKE